MKGTTNIKMLDRSFRCESFYKKFEDDESLNWAGNVAEFVR